MKKILTLFLVFALCLTAFVGCDNTNTGANSALESAKDYIRSMYKDDAEATPSDYNVVASTMVDGVKYDITWTVNITSGDTNGIKVVPGENNTVTIDVDEKATADIVYTLVGTIASPEGQTITVEFNRKVPAFAVMSYADYAAVEDDSAVVVRGIITGIFSATNGSSGNGMYIQDNNNEGGYYVYGFADSKDPEADLGLKVGMDVIVTGTKDTYNGLYEVVGAVVEIVNSEPATVTPVDYTDIFKNATDLAATDLVGKQSMLVTIKGVEITGQDTSNGYFKFKLGDKETYIRISSSNNCISKTEIETFKTTHTTNFGNTCDVTGIVQLFNGNFYLIPATVDAFTDITAVEKTDDQKVATEKDNLSFNSSLNKGGEYTLPTAGTIYTDVTITWVSDNAAAVVDGGKLTVTLPDADTTVNLTATLKCGSVTETKVFEVKLYAGALSYADIVDMAYGLAPGAALDGTYRLFGVITSIDTVWSDQYSNITVTIQIGDKTDKLIQCYRLKGDGAKDLKVGDAITVEGTIKNYNGTIEFDSGCILVGMGEIISQEAIVEEAYKLGVGEAMEGTQTLTGVITSVDTAWSDQYSNITVTIQVGNLTDKLIQCFRLKGDGAKDLKVGDTITVSGTIKNYNGTIEFDAGCNLDALTAGSGSTEDTTPSTPSTPSTPANVTRVTTLATDTEYYIYSVIGAGDLFFNGTLSSGRINGTADLSAAVAVKLEATATAGEYYIYFMNGSTKTYIGYDPNASGKTSAYVLVENTASENCIWVIDASAQTIICKNFANRGIATQVASTYTNFSTYATSNFTSSEYCVAWFVTKN